MILEAAARGGGGLRCGTAGPAWFALKKTSKCLCSGVKVLALLPVGVTGYVHCASQCSDSVKRECLQLAGTAW